MKRILLVLLLLVAPAAAGAETLRSEADTLALSRRMMDVAMTQPPGAAFAVLKPYWPMDPAEIDGLASKASLQWQVIEARFGKPLGYELVSTERIGQSFVRYVYLQKFEKHALRWRVSFYRPRDAWITNQFAFDDQFESLYVEH
ncbi:MAG: hypothetical protein ABS96_20195 [Lysobacteraceae bacterium SCN 69-123]|uniref:hypothetical protein n=1 Tax=Stenotrophomonas acidaminiphila TaxID=128780 RepID=UPI00086A4DFC|nr:hypothetical protein [Stenotrophomonas acidaminiphila]MDF9440831.1 hypothetical protein [Stenotrophomonas acidaminiphila]ODU43845.1 MAG: hypothetical protein ABS96_20195 [Xanthomonadaceae bacterium SCN 69-123]OJY72505.1 MAG: hypothetical protein BGP18_06725 [Stenotrophomonas sp. 69-14]